MSSDQSEEEDAVTGALAAPRQAWMVLLEFPGLTGSGCAFWRSGLAEVTGRAAAAQKRVEVNLIVG
ncbi:hypothetical protein CTA1_8518 [Colletotrichum tanaceti]|uniref:Uncharacterized protein n=1 Tax=Colletotrichum tanaceti TaxID=1306861 RepID=A0A4U6XNT8_9PEZI|nr:hypothetical protein CTA1_8518 [Colletotrichum tanaceti]